MRKFSVAVGLALVVAWGSWLLAAPPVGPVAIAPSTAVVGVPTAVTVTALIQDPLLISASVNLQQIDATGKVVAIVGTLRDDGTNGDVVAGDKTFTIRWSVQPAAIGQLRYQVSAGFRGMLKRIMSTPVSLDVTRAQWSVQPVLDASQPVVGTVGLLGGRLSITGSDGTHFTLTIPAGALSDDYEMSLLPLLGLGGLPPAGTFIAGVRLQPDGLTFAIPAELSIELPAGAPVPGDLLGYAYQGNGEEFHAKPAFVSGNTVTLYLRHFTGDGVFTATEESCAALKTSPPSDPNEAHEQLLACVDFATDRYATELADSWPAIRDEMSADGDPSLCTPASLTDAAGLYALFLRYRDLMDLQNDPVLEAAVAEGSGLLERAVSCVQPKVDQACKAATTCSAVQSPLSQLSQIQRLVDLFGLAGVETLTSLCDGLFSVSIQGAADPLIRGTSRALTAIATSRLGAPVLTWKSDAPEVASVTTPGGVVTGNRVGDTFVNVEAVQCGMSVLAARATTAVKVVDPPAVPVPISVAPSGRVIAVGDTLMLEARAANGDPLAAGKIVSWTIPPGLAIASMAGSSVTVRGVNPGVYKITAELDGFTAHATVEVVSLAKQIAVGETVTLTAACPAGSLVSWTVPAALAIASQAGNAVTLRGVLPKRGYLVTAECAGARVSTTVNVTVSGLTIKWKVRGNWGLDYRTFPVGDFLGETCTESTSIDWTGEAHYVGRGEALPDGSGWEFIGDLTTMPQTGTLTFARDQRRSWSSGAFTVWTYELDGVIPDDLVFPWSPETYPYSYYVKQPWRAKILVGEGFCDPFGRVDDFRCTAQQGWSSVLGVRNVVYLGMASSVIVTSTDKDGGVSQGVTTSVLPWGDVFLLPGVIPMVEGGESASGFRKQVFIPFSPCVSYPEGWSWTWGGYESCANQGGVLWDVEVIVTK